MPEIQTKVPSNVAPILKPTRAKSSETILKEKMRKLTRDLEALDKKVADFEALEKQMTGVDKEREEVNEALEAVKASLIKELGLG
tara:strand:- start:23394 stop:23648 length:255 start_codon:yes stop_codon:yes gene_type:complete